MVPRRHGRPAASLCRRLLYVPTEQMPGELAKLATLDKPDLLGLIERMMGYMLDTGMFYPVAEE